MMKIGIIGGGNMGQLHGRLINQDKRLTLSAIYDTVPENGEAAALNLNTRYIGDINKFFEEIDMVFIAVPNTHHAELTLKALEKGLDVFVEKPLATNQTDAAKVKEACIKSGKRVFVGYNRRFAPIYTQAKEIVNAPGFKPVNVNIIQNDGDMINPPWLMDVNESGGFMYDTTVHFLDMARYLFGEITELRALAKAAFYPMINDFTVMMTFANGMIGVISTCGHASWISPFERVQVVGDHQSLITEELDSLVYSPGLNEIIQSKNYSKLSHEQKWGYAQMHTHMFDCLFNNKPAINDIEDGYQCVRLIEACYESARNDGSAIKF